MPVVEPSIIVLTGIQGAGKSTIGPLLAASFEKSAFVDADDLAWMVVSGQAWVGEPGDPISPGAQEQLDLRLHNGCLLARSFRNCGFTVVLVDIILGDRWDQLREELSDTPFYLVVLAPAAETVVKREAARGKKTILGPKWAYYLDGELRRTMGGVGLWVDSTHQTPPETVAEILNVLFGPSAISAQG